MKVLIIEDEPKTASYLKKGLSESGFVVDVASDGEEGLHQALDNSYDVIVSEVMLPRIDGWAILSRLRERGVATPVLYPRLKPGATLVSLPTAAEPASQLFVARRRGDRLLR